MKKLKFLAPALSLIVVAVGIAFLLAVVNFITADKIAENALKEKSVAIEKLFPELEAFYPIEAENLPKEVLEVGEVKNEAGVILGRYAEVSSSGFKGPISLIVGFDTDGKILNVKCLSASETPSVGTKATDESYLSTFKNANIASVTQVDTISGATITSKAVIKGVNMACVAEKAIREAK